MRDKGRSAARMDGTTHGTTLGGVLLALAVVVAGSGLATAGADGDGRIPWSMIDCTGAAAFLFVDRAKVEERLPDDFRPLTPSEVFGGPRVGDDTAFLAVDLVDCDEEDQGTDTAHVLVPVEPPAEHVVEEATLHAFKWDVLVADDELRASLQAADADVRGGDLAAWSSFSVGPVAHLDGAINLTGPEETYAFQGLPLVDTGDRIVRFAQFSETDEPGAFVVWFADVTWADLEVGPGRVQLPPGGWVAEIVGDDDPVATIARAPTTYADGWIELPA